MTCTINGKKATETVFKQHRVDAWNNGADQLPRDGNILGLRR